VRRFFEPTLRSCQEQGCVGCLLGGVGQKSSGVSDVFRGRIEACFSEIASGLAGLLVDC